MNEQSGKAALPSSNSSLARTSDVELLSQLIGKGKAAKLYRGSLRPFFADGDDCETNPRCAVARELVKRWLHEDLQARATLDSPDAVKAFLTLHFAGREYESFVVLFLDSQHRLIVAEEMFRGTVSQTSVYPREIVKAVLRRNASSVIFSHNHPSGLPEPSRADEALTQTLKSALSLVDVRVLDHIVVAGATSLSFAERGLI